MRHNLDLTDGLITSEAVMMDLAPVIGRQEAHDLVYGAAQTAATTDTSFGAVLRGHPRLSELLDEDALDRLLDPARHHGRSAQIATETARAARAHLAQKAGKTETKAG